jgi:hypothetical protein
MSNDVENNGIKTIILSKNETFSIIHPFIECMNNRIFY